MYEVIETIKSRKKIAHVFNHSRPSAFFALSNKISCLILKCNGRERRMKADSRRWETFVQNLLPTR